MPNSRLLPLFILGTLVITAFAVFFILSLIIQKQRQVKNRLHRQQKEFEYSSNLLNTKIEVQESTLNMIAQELHDNIAQVLTASFNQISKAGSYIREDASRQLLDEARQSVKTAIRDIRLLSHSLATGLIESRPINAAIEAELDRISTFSELHCRFHDTADHALSAEQRLMVFRVVQEALQNIVKHAQATAVDVSLFSDDSVYVVKVADNGVGFEMPREHASNSLGMINLQERTRLLGGTLGIQSAPGQGTILTLEIPLHP